MNTLAYSLIIILVLQIPVSCSETCMEGTSTLRTDLDLSVSPDGHFLLNGDKPFFWMGDTGWLLFTRTPEEIEYYLQCRRGQRFNVIQIMVTHRRFNDYEFTPNYRGDTPIASINPLKINEAYFSYIDSIVSMAERKSLVLVMFPVWGTVIDQIFSSDEPDRAYDFGYLLGNRYKDSMNVIWAVCGEYHKIAWDTEKKEPDSEPDERELSLIEHLARGLRAGSEGKNLMTIHPDGWKSSSEDFHNADWLDFNMVQSFSIGAGTEYIIYNDYKRKPPKPTILAEPGYEFGGAGHKAFEVRYEGYHSVLNGGLGDTYGCQGVWDFAEDWKGRLKSEGAGQMRYMRKLFESRPFMKRLPAPDMLAGETGIWAGKSKAAAALSQEGDYAFVYFPNDTLKLNVNIGMLSGRSINAWWYNPRDGNIYSAENNQVRKPFAVLEFNQTQIAEFDPPGNSGYGKDWVLILDDASKNYRKP